MECSLRERARPCTTRICRHTAVHAAVLHLGMAAKRSSVASNRLHDKHARLHHARLGAARRSDVSGQHLDFAWGELHAVPGWCAARTRPWGVPLEIEIGKAVVSQSVPLQKEAAASLLGRTTICNGHAGTRTWPPNSSSSARLSAMACLVSEGMTVIPRCAYR